MPRIADRMRLIEPFYVMDVLSRARDLEAQGRSIIHMEIGEPDFITPQPVINAGMAALQAGYTQYTPALGLTELRQRIAGFYRQNYQIEILPEQVIITPGASGALMLVLGILINPQAQVLMADPGYPCNRHFIRLYGGEPVSIPVDATTSYQLTANLIERHWTDQTSAALLASPSNPTGTLVADQEMQNIIDCVNSHGGTLIVDEIYHGLVYEGTAKSALSLTDNVFVINSFSKFFGMTGWRIGWIVAPTPYIEPIDRLAQNIFLAAPTLAQYAAMKAFAPETLVVLEMRRREFMARRDYLLPQLRSLGFDIPVTPQGAFYLYAGCSHFTSDSYAFTLDMLEKAGVAITPGRDFGANQSSRHVRFAYTTSLENLHIGVERLQHYLKKY
jgi:aspartate/methionine/tyrosine aminotransferase